MKIEQIYLGIWFQRTSLHLKELFLHLQKNTTNEKMENLSEISTFSFLGNNEFDEVVGTCPTLSFSITEDGIILLKSSQHKVENAKHALETFYVETLSPLLLTLFGSTGAPIPKTLGESQSIYPAFLFVTKKPKESVSSFFIRHNDRLITTLKGNRLSMYIGEIYTLFHLKQPSILTVQQKKELVQYVIFFREFEQQLSGYLNQHRAIWDQVTKFRRSQTMTYRDFPQIRKELLSFSKTISFIRARLAQMDDIMKERHDTIDPTLKHELKNLGMHRFDHLIANQKYVVHLWDMTREYVSDTLTLLESLYQENAQKELSAIKYITFGALITGFFGMNIIFPWDETWQSMKLISWFVVLLIPLLSLVFYTILRIIVHNRKFISKHHHIF